MCPIICVGEYASYTDTSPVHVLSKAGATPSLSRGTRAVTPKGIPMVSEQWVYAASVPDPGYSPTARQNNLRKPKPNENIPCPDIYKTFFIRF